MSILDDMQKMKRKRLIIAGTILATLAVSAFAFHHRYLKVYYGYDPLPFSVKGWAEANPETRGHMANDLLQNYGLKNRSKNEIEELLGPPDDTHNGSMYYNVGYMGFNPNALMVFSETLVIHFNEDDLSTEAHTFD